MKHTMEQVEKYIKILQQLHTAGKLEPVMVYQLEDIRGWKWDGVTPSYSVVWGDKSASESCGHNHRTVWAAYYCRSMWSQGHVRNNISGMYVCITMPDLDLDANVSIYSAGFGADMNESCILKSVTTTAANKHSNSEYYTEPDNADDE